MANEKGLKIVTKFQADLPVILADKNRLAEVFNNLISNALKFTQEGEIAIIVSCEQKKKMLSDASLFKSKFTPGA